MNSLLVPGFSALCREFTNQQGIEIDFLHDDVPRTVHPDVALCLFRIVQEALRNLKKHSGATKAQVRLRKVGDELRVSVSDEGIGFDWKQVQESGPVNVLLRTRRGIMFMKASIDRVRYRHGGIGGADVQAWREVPNELPDVYED